MKKIEQSKQDFINYIANDMGYDSYDILELSEKIVQTRDSVSDFIKSAFSCKKDSFLARNGERSSHAPIELTRLFNHQLKKGSPRKEILIWSCVDGINLVWIN